MKTPSRMSLEKSTYDRKNNIYCYKVSVSNTCSNTSSRCCNMDLVKVELFAKNAAQCRGSHAYTLVDGKQKPPQLMTTPGGVLKISNLKLTINQSNGTEICVALKSPCATPEELFGSQMPWYSLFDTPSGNQCCVIKKLA